jgi:hypothetical protein
VRGAAGRRRDGRSLRRRPGGRKKAATIARRLAAIAEAHKAAGHPSPTADAVVKTVWSGVRRTHGTAQEGEGRKVGIPYGSNPTTCPVRAVRAWLEAAAVTDGPLFRRVDRHGRRLPDRLGDRAVALAVKRAATPASLEPARYAGHSLRAGLATAASNVPERVIALQTGHRSMTVLRRYIRQGSLFTENAAAAVGL